MAPKRKSKQEESGDESEDVSLASEPSEEDDVEVEEEDEELKVKKKRAAPKKKTAGGSASKKAKTEDGGAAGSGSQEAGTQKGAKGKAAAKPRVKNEKLTEPTQLEDGWTAHPPGLLYKDYGSTKSAKIAGFDFDGTLVLVRSGSQFSTSSYDWKPYNDKVYAKLREYHDQGYKIVVFTNQGGVRSALAGAMSKLVRGKVDQFLAKAGVPALVLAATQKDSYRKPDRGMWDFMCEHLTGGVTPDVSQSFFVGDSIDGGDEGFATAVGLTYRDEKQEFGPPDTGPAPGGPAPAATADNPNAVIVHAFECLGQKFADDRFKGAAFKKAALALASFPKKITDDKAVLKEVAALQGVGKGSMEKIKEILATGKVALLDESLPENKVAKEVANQQRDQALQFM